MKTTFYILNCLNAQRKRRASPRPEPTAAKKRQKKIEGKKVRLPYQYMHRTIWMRSSATVVFPQEIKKKSVNRFNKQGEQITDCHQVVWWRPQPLRMEV